MKAILEFNLPEDQYAFNLASKAGNIHNVIWTLDQYLRTTLKHGSDEFKKSEYKTIEKIRGQLHDIMQVNDVKFD